MVTQPKTVQRNDAFLSKGEVRAFVEAERNSALTGLVEEDRLAWEHLVATFNEAEGAFWALRTRTDLEPDAFQRAYRLSLTGPDRVREAAVAFIRRHLSAARALDAAARAAIAREEATVAADWQLVRKLRSDWNRTELSRGVPNGEPSGLGLPSPASERELAAQQAGIGVRLVEPTARIHASEQRTAPIARLREAVATGLWFILPGVQHFNATERDIAAYAAGWVRSLSQGK